KSAANSSRLIRRARKNLSSGLAMSNSLEQCLESKTPSSCPKNRRLQPRGLRKVARSYASPHSQQIGGSNRTVVPVNVRGGKMGPLNRQERKSWILPDRACLACVARRHKDSSSGKVLARRLMSQHPR